MTEPLWESLRDPDFLRGVVYRHDAQLRDSRSHFLERLNEVRSELIDEIREVKRAVEERDDWRETTAVRNQRRADLARLQARADEADDAAVELARERNRARRNVAVLAPAIGAFLYALAELVKAFAHH